MPILKEKENTFRILYFIISDINRFISSKRKFKLFILLILAIFAGIFDLLSLSSLIPFITIISSDPNKYIPEFDKFLSLININSFSSVSYYVIFITGIFITAVTLANMTKLIYFRSSQYIAAEIGNDFSRIIFSKVLNQNYSYFLKLKSASILSVYSNHIHTTIGTIKIILNIFGASVITLVVTTTLFIKEPEIFMILLISLTSLVFLVALYSKPKYKKNSKILVDDLESELVIVQESLRGIKNIIIDSLKDIQVRNLTLVDKRLRRSDASNAFLSSLPKYLLETFTILTVAIASAYIVLFNNDKNAILTIGFLLLASQRLLPALNVLYLGWSRLSSTFESVIEIHNLLELKEDNNFDKIKENDRNLFFSNQIELVDITFQYEGSNTKILDKLSLKVMKGDVIGIIGKTGSGKSTLLDLLSFFIFPTKGEVIIDGKTLKNENKKLIQKTLYKKLALVPQSLYFWDKTIAENITLTSKDQIDLEKLEKVSKAALIFDFVKNLEHKYNTHVGEDGINLSGGQKQRIAIARALYKDPEFLILDEATSAIDKKNEDKLMKNLKIYFNNITVIIVAHRVETLSYCNKIYEISNGKAKTVNNIFN